MNQEAFEKDIISLLECEVTVPITKLSQALFSKLEIEPIDLLPLLYLFEVEQ